MSREREFFIDNLLVRIHFIIEMIWWTGLAPWEFEFPFPGSLISTFLIQEQVFSAWTDACPEALQLASLTGMDLTVICDVQMVTFIYSKVD